MNTIPISRIAAPENANSMSPLIGVVALMRRAGAGENLVPLGQTLLARALRNPLDANAYLDFATVLFLTGNREHALAVQREAIGLQPLYPQPRENGPPGLRLLTIMGPGDLMANTPIEFLVEDSDVDLQVLYLLPDADWPESVPEHDVMLVAVGESDDSRALMDRLKTFVRDWPRPIINPPERIAGLSRDRVSASLHGVPGLDMPVSVRATRGDLLALSKGSKAIEDMLPDGGFPVILRPLGSHAGTNLERLEDAAEIGAYLARTEGEAFYVARYVDYRDDDGLFRKYRVALIDGKPFLCHMAVSSHWIIHYANAGMSESPEKRAEEARCMAEFDASFAPRHVPAWRAIHERTGLDYSVIDCARTGTGDLLVFEVDNAAVVHNTDPADLYPYKDPAMRKVFAGFRQLLERARGSSRSA